MENIIRRFYSNREQDKEQLRNSITGLKLLQQRRFGEIEPQVHLSILLEANFISVEEYCKNTALVLKFSNLFLNKNQNR